MPTKRRPSITKKEALKFLKRIGACSGKTDEVEQDGAYAAWLSAECVDLKVLYEYLLRLDGRDFEIIPAGHTCEKNADRLRRHFSWARTLRLVRKFMKEREDA